MTHRALITGVTGFAGGLLAEHLRECGDAVLGCSPNGKWCPESTPAVANRVELVAWDLADPQGPSESARRQIERFQPDVIYHLAALSVPDECGVSDPTAEAVAVNVEGTRRVVELAASLPSPARLLFTSSSMVYAPVEAHSALVAENARLEPVNGYGKTKLAAEEIVLDACRQHGLDAVVARSFQHTGPGQDGRMMLPSWARQFASAANGPIEVYTLEAKMDLSDGRDVVRAYRLLALRGQSGLFYNVGRGACSTSGEVFAMLRRLADPTGTRPVVQTRPGARQNPIADISRLVAATGWRTRIPLLRTVRDTLDWWQRHASGNAGDA